MYKDPLPDPLPGFKFVTGTAWIKLAETRAKDGPRARQALHEFKNFSNPRSCSNPNVIERLSMNKFKSTRLTLSKLIFIKLIRALFIYLPQLVSIHLAQCISNYTNVSGHLQRVFAQYEQRDYQSPRPVLLQPHHYVFCNIYSGSTKRPAVRTVSPQH